MLVAELLVELAHPWIYEPVICALRKELVRIKIRKAKEDLARRMVESFGNSKQPLVIVNLGLTPVSKRQRVRAAFLTSAPEDIGAPIKFQSARRAKNASGFYWRTVARNIYGGLSALPTHLFIQQPTKAFVVVARGDGKVVYWHGTYSSRNIDSIKEFTGRVEAALAPEVIDLTDE